jgi:hypothetical protein
MEEDRNALMTHAWPELRRFCRECHEEQAKVDFQWSSSEEQSSREEGVKFCLDGIARPGGSAESDP